MSRLSNRRQRAEQDTDTDIDMAPVMNLFLVLIPFLLMSASFLHLKGVNASVPVLAERSSDSTPEKDIKIIVIIEIGEDNLKLSAMSDQLAPEALDKFDSNINKNEAGEYPFQDLATALAKIKQTYSKSDIVLMVPAQEILYDTIIQAMDAARHANAKPLFPNVVLSGKVG